METVHFARTSSSIGLIRVATTEVGLAYVELPHGSGTGLADWVERHASGARCVEGEAPNRGAIDQILEYLDAGRTEFELPLDLRGTPFQRAVWKALQEIPYGETCSYADIADAVGKPGGQRAVGGANNANPIALVVPCHRVIAADGRLGGYGGGVELKAKLLAMERSHAPERGDQLL